MTRHQAINIAIASMRERIKFFNVDANLHEQLGMDTPTGRRASKERKKLRAAIEYLEGMLSEGSADNVSLTTNP